MPNKLAIFVALGAALIIIIFGVALFAAMYKKSSTTDVEKISMQKEINVSEIQKHAKSTDCWTYVGGQVFNATKIITDYPEHASTLVKACGKDGTSIYTIQKYTGQTMNEKDIAKVRTALGAYQIGLLSPSN